jgi:hypothetical protein
MNVSVRIEVVVGATRCMSEVELDLPSVHASQVKDMLNDGMWHVLLQHYGKDGVAKLLREESAK